MSLSNNYINWEVRSLKDSKGMHCGFVVLQPLRTTKTVPERMFVLQRDGSWIEREFLILLPEKYRASVLFSSLSEIAQLSYALDTKARIVSVEGLLATVVVSDAVSESLLRKALTE